MKKETLDEAAHIFGSRIIGSLESNVTCFKGGADWQKEVDKTMYTEEQVRILLHTYFDWQWDNEKSDDKFEEWFEENKKK